MSPLWEATRDLHHACEAHPVGAAMAKGTPPLAWYAGWLQVLYQYHYAIDPHLPECVHRADRIAADLQATGITPTPSASTAERVAALTDDTAIAGAAYVLTGAHLMGGELMRRRLDGYPTKHLEWDDRKAALSVLQTYRTREDLAPAARECFAGLLAGMDEILGAEALTGA